MLTNKIADCPGHKLRGASETKKAYNALFERQLSCIDTFGFRGASLTAAGSRSPDAVEKKWI